MEGCYLIFHELLHRLHFIATFPRDSKLRRWNREEQLVPRYNNKLPSGCTRKPSGLAAVSTLRNVRTTIQYCSIYIIRHSVLFHSLLPWQVKEVHINIKRHRSSSSNCIYLRFTDYYTNKLNKPIFPMLVLITSHGWAYRLCHRLGEGSDARLHSVLFQPIYYVYMYRYLCVCMNVHTHAYVMETCTMYMYSRYTSILL